MAEVIINKRHQQQLSPAASILPENILLQTLLLLPLKDVIRCKSVCKSWYALLTDPYFLSLYSHRRIIISYPKKSSQFRFQSVGFEGLDGDQIIENLEFPTQSIFDLQNHLPIKKMDYHEEFDVEIVGSCKGLMLCMQNGNRLFLWNPTTRACMKLPRYEVYFLKNIYIFYGLGFDSSSNDYKVVRGFKSLGQGIQGIQIYSRKTNSWKTIQDLPCHSSRKTGAFANGFLHWLALAHNGGYEIVSLDLIEEKVSYVSLPDNYGNESCIIHFGALEGLLCIVCNSYADYEARAWTLWVMKEYGVKESWTVLMKIPRKMKTERVKPLFVSKNGEAIVQVREKIVKYDPKSEKFVTLLECACGIDSTTIRESLDAPTASFKEM